MEFYKPYIQERSSVMIHILWTGESYCNFTETDVVVEFGLSLLGLINLAIICTGDFKNYTLQTEMSILIQ